MMASREGDPPRGAGTTTGGDAGGRLAEALFAASLLGALTLGIVLAMPGGQLAFAQPFWLDEYHTGFVAGAPGLTRIWTDLARGADFNPPLLHLMVRPLALSGDGLTPLELRAFSFACVFGALNLLYWALRQEFDGLASLVGTLAVSSHPLVVDQAFTGRFYAPLLFFTALLALLLARPGPWGRRRRFLLGVAAVGVCTIHYFGVVALALMLAGYLSLRSSRRFGSAVLPLAAGPLALAACTPLYLGQKAALPVATWVADPSPAMVMDFLNPFLAWLPGVASLLVLWAGHWVRSRAGNPSPPGETRTRPLLALFAFPAFCVVFSLLVQSVLIPRYSIVAVLGFGPLAAMAVSRLGSLPRGAALLLLGLLSLRAYGPQAVQGAGWAEMVAEHREEIHRFAGGGEPVVVLERWRFYSAVAPDAPLQREVWLFAPATAEMDEGLREAGVSPRWRSFFQVESATARIHSGLYGYPPVTSPEALRERESFVVVATPGLVISVPQFVRAFFPGYQATAMGPGGDWPARLWRAPEPPSS